MTAYGSAAASAAAAHIRSRLDHSPESIACAVVLGSGLGAVADSMRDAESLPYAQVPGFPSATVAGHGGRVVLGRIGAQWVAAFDGRAHLYEGHDAGATAFCVRVARALGARAVFLVNAAGGIRASLAPGSVLVIDDHINFSFRNPLVGAVQHGEVRFPDMSAPFDSSLTEAIAVAAGDPAAPAPRGVYASVLGPSYETAAEIRMLATLGADAVGMSTVPEVLAARAAGLRVAAMSVIANRATGADGAQLTHAEVLAAVPAAIPRVTRALHAFAPLA